MTSRLLISALSIGLAAGALALGADDAKDAKPLPPPPPRGESAPSGPPKGEPPRPEGKDSRDDKRRPGPPGSGDRPDRNWGPREGGGDWGRGRVIDQFSADELREMIRAVEGSNNKRLAEKMKDRFEEAIARRPQQLTKEQLDAALGVFEDREPHLANRLKESLEKDPQRVGAILLMQWPRLEKTIELKKSDPELYNAQTQEILRQSEARGITWRLSHAIREKNEAEAAKLKAELKEKLVAQHQARQEIRRLELARLDNQVKKLSAEIAAEDEKAGAEIEKRYNSYINFAENPRFDRGRGDRERGEKKDGEHKERE